jgi:hypothetical protein
MALSKQIIQPIELATGLPCNLNKSDPLKSNNSSAIAGWVATGGCVTFFLTGMVVIIGNAIVGHNLFGPSAALIILSGSFAIGSLSTLVLSLRAHWRERRERLPFDRGVGENPVRFVRRMYRKFAVLNQRIEKFNHDLATCQDSIAPSEVEHWQRCRKILITEQDTLVAEVQATVERQLRADELRLEAYRLQCSGSVATKSLVTSGCVDPQGHERGLDVLTGHAQRQHALEDGLLALSLSGRVTEADIEAIKARRESQTTPLSVPTRRPLGSRPPPPPPPPPKRYLNH